MAEARRLDAEMQRCADDGAADPDGLRLAGPVAVGAQGYGLARRYDAGGTPSPFGVFAAVTRRGNAVTLVAHHQRRGHRAGVEARGARRRPGGVGAAVPLRPHGRLPDRVSR